MVNKSIIHSMPVLSIITAGETVLIANSLEDLQYLVKKITMFENYTKSNLT